MKLCAGRTYEEAIAFRPITKIQREDRDEIKKICESYEVVLDYKPVQGKGCRYMWKFRAPFCYYVIDKHLPDHGLVLKEDGSGKPIAFKSIYRAMVWIYNHDREFYDGMRNLSTRGKEDNNDEKSKV